MRRERQRVEHPTARRALKELLVPSIPLKLGAGADTGRPDYLFLIPGGRPLFVEFKWGDYTPEPKQEYWHGILRNLGYDVEVHNSEDEALCAIAEKVVAAQLPKKGRKVPVGARSSGAFLGSWARQNKHYARSIQFLEEAGRR